MDKSLFGFGIDGGAVQSVGLPCGHVKVGFKAMVTRVFVMSLGGPKAPDLKGTRTSGLQPINAKCRECDV